MPLKNYGVLVGKVVDRRREGGSQSPHYQIHVRGGGTDFRVAVNVMSQLAPSELLYLANEDFRHPLLAELAGSPDGFNTVSSKPGGVALDFVRANLFDRLTMRPLPPDVAGPDNDLADSLDRFVGRAMADPAAKVFVFGERWGPEAGRKDKIFGFAPGNGVHDVHMNQGNVGQFQRDNGVWQDGALLLHFPGAPGKGAVPRWVGVFLAFQSQAWHTDDVTGNALATVPPPGPGPQPSPGVPDGTVRVVAALVNPVGPAPEAETVTLLNTTANPVDLTGWKIVDRDGNAVTLTPTTLPPGEALRVLLGPPVALSNRGGAITLLDATGLKVDGVSYLGGQVAGDQVAGEGRTIVF
jgi:uncharacterized protein YukJ